MNAAPWVIERDLLQDSERPRLFCLPHAGSGVAGFYRWKRLLPEMSVCPVHLPGRDMRLGESAFYNGDALAAAMHDALRGCLDRPYAIFGHSMGALLAFAWARLIESEDLPRPIAVFVSARGPRPRAGHDPDTWLRADDDALLRSGDERFGGNAASFLQDPEMRAAFLPVLRADMHVVETVRVDGVLTVPVLAACGAADPSVSQADMQAWNAHTSARFDSAVFPGGHFYHFGEGQAELLRWVGNAVGGD